MLGYMSADIICSKKRNRKTRKTESFEKHIFSSIIIYFLWSISIFELIFAPNGGYCSSYIFETRIPVRHLKDDFYPRVESGVFFPLFRKSTDFCINKYFLRVDTVQKLHEMFKYPILDVYSRDMIAKPRETLHKLCSFLNVTCDNEFIT